MHDISCVNYGGVWITGHWEVRMRDTMSPYKAKASPKIRIRIIPTNILSCWALARTPASPTIPIASPAALVSKELRENWSRSTVLKRGGRRPTCQGNCCRLNQNKSTSLYDDYGHDHTVNTKDTGHNDWHHWLHNEFRLEDTHGADSHSSLSATIGCSEVGEDEGGGDSDVSEEELRAVFIGASLRHGCELIDLINIIIAIIRSD